MNEEERALLEECDNTKPLEHTSMSKQLLSRLKEPHVLALIVVGIYQGLKLFDVEIPEEGFKTAMDYASYVLFGYFIYGTDKDKLV